MSHVREKGDKVFGECSARLLTDSFVTDAPDSDDFFPDIDNLLDDMADEDTDHIGSAPTVQYVILSS